MGGRGGGGAATTTLGAGGGGGGGAATTTLGAGSGGGGPGGFEVDILASSLGLILSGNATGAGTFTGTA